MEDEEKLQLRSDVERLKRQIRQKDDMIEEMEQELTSGRHAHGPVSDGKAEAREKELNAQIRDLQFEMDGKTTTIGEKEELIEKLRDEIDRLEKSNRELANRSVVSESDESSSFHEVEMVKLGEQLEECRHHIASLEEQNLQLRKEALQLKEEHEMVMDHVKNLESHIKTGEEEIARLEGEVFDLRHSNQGKHATTGNSIFAEAMEAEQKLEQDLKTCYAENQALKKKIRRVILEKEDAEELARSAMGRGVVVRTAINHIDVLEMNRLRAKVHELEKERTLFWLHLFEKMKAAKITRRELGGLIAGYFESFKCSIASVTGGQEEILKKNEQFVTTIRGLQQENENLRVKTEQLQFDIGCLNRKLRSAINSGSSDDPEQLRQPLKPVDNSRPSFFHKRAPVVDPAVQSETSMSSSQVPEQLRQPLKPFDNSRPSFFQRRAPVVESAVPLDSSMSSMHMTPQKPAFPQTTCSSQKENTSEWAERRQKAKAERKQAATPAAYNYVTLLAPQPKFKLPTLKMPSSPTTPRVHEE